MAEKKISSTARGKAAISPAFDASTHVPPFKASIESAENAPKPPFMPIAAPAPTAIPEAIASVVERSADIATSAVEQAVPAIAETQETAVEHFSDAADHGIAAAEATVDMADEASAAAIGTAQTAIADITELPVDQPQQPTTVATLAPGHEGQKTMATILEMPTFSTDKASALFGGLNDKAKAALAKSTKIGEELTELTKGNVEAIVASSKLAAKGAETIGADVVETGKKSLEATMTAFKSMAAVKSPTELFQLQSEFAKSSFDTAIADASKFSESWMKLAGEIFQPLSNRYAIAAEKIKTAAL